MREDKIFERILNDLNLDTQKYRVIKIHVDGVVIQRNLDKKREKVRY